MASRRWMPVGILFLVLCFAIGARFIDDTSMLVVGQAYWADASTPTTMTNQNDWYQINGTEAAAGELHNVTHSGGALTIANAAGAGLYEISFTGCGVISAANEVLETIIAVNGTGNTACKNRKKVGTATDIIAVAVHCVVSLVNTNVVTALIRNTTSGGKTYTQCQGQLTVRKL